MSKRGSKGRSRRAERPGPAGPVTDLFDPRRGDPPFRVEDLDSHGLGRASRTNYFSVVWARQGTGVFHVDSHAHAFFGPALLFANPYQTLLMGSPRGVAGARLNFHANFFCIETHHQEVGCNGVLFNDIYGPPVLSVPEDRAGEFDEQIALLREEAGTAGLAQGELLLSYLKVLLIKATRLKIQQRPCGPRAGAPTPGILERLIELIEIHYQKKHSPGDYSALLGISGKALNRLVKAHWGRTLTQVIRERILKHARWHLLHTRKPVKEVAGEVGFADEFYFSRLFKRETGWSPTAFRDFETAIRGGRNLTG